MYSPRPRARRGTYKSNKTQSKHHKHLTDPQLWERTYKRSPSFKETVSKQSSQIVDLHSALPISRNLSMKKVPTRDLLTALKEHTKCQDSSGFLRKLRIHWNAGLSYISDIESTRESELLQSSFKNIMPQKRIP